MARGLTICERNGVPKVTRVICPTNWRTIKLKKEKAAAALAARAAVQGSAVRRSLRQAIQRSGVVRSLRLPTAPKRSGAKKSLRRGTKSKATRRKLRK